jgi:tetratricopeptide (TPR) repeat protein
MMRWWITVIPVGILLQLLAGCHPSDEILADDARNPYVTSGISYVNSYEHDAAIGAFEKALETNPHSVRAHYELGLLYEKHKEDYVTAIYHYQRVLKLKNTGWPSENVKLLIGGCRQELVKDEALGPIVLTMKRNIKSLQSTNDQLRIQIDSLKNQLADARSQPRPTPTRPSPSTLRQPSPSTTTPSIVDPPTRDIRPRPAPRRPSGGLTFASTRIYTLKKGDTLYQIARKFNVSVSDLKAANPGINPNKMSIGFQVRIPSR